MRRRGGEKWKGGRKVSIPKRLLFSTERHPDDLNGVQTAVKRADQKAKRRYSGREKKGEKKKKKKRQKAVQDK